MNRQNDDPLWSDEAPGYFRLEGTIKLRILYPQLLDLAGDVRGQRVLDFGCGEGDLAVQLAERGAQVLGTDPDRCSVACAHARHAARTNLRFQHLPASDYILLDQLEPFDLAILSVVLGNVPEPTGVALMNAIAHAVRPGGRLLLGDNHPCFRHYDFSTVAQTVDPQQYSQSGTPIQVAVRDGYAPERTATFTNYHRPLATLIGLVCQAGFLIRALHEIYDADDSALHPQIRQRVNPFVPVGLVIDAVKSSV